MGWKRIKGRDYYYKCLWVKGKVRTRYYGAGELAELACVLDVEEAEEREERRRAERAERERVLGIDRTVDEWCGQVEELARAVMTLAGFHRHARGQWRRRRDTMSTKAKAKPVTELTSREVNALCGRAQDGDESVLPTVRAIMKAEVAGTRPDCDLVGYYGSSARWLVRALAHDLVSEHNLASQAAIPLQLKRMRKELEGENPTALERLLAERVVLCHFLVNHYEALYVQAKSLTLPQAEFYQARITAANKRFLMAARTLAQVRKLTLPVLMVNVAQAQQFNVNGQPAPT